MGKAVNLIKAVNLKTVNLITSSRGVDDVKHGCIFYTAGTRLPSRNPSNLKDWCQDSWGPDQFPAPKSPSENNYYLFNSHLTQ